MTTKETKQKLEKYAPRLGKSVEEVNSEYDQYFEKAKLKYPNLKGQRLENKGIELLVNSYRRKHGDVRYSRAEMFEGWIDGATPLRNQVEEKMRRVTWLVKNQGRQQALLNEMIDENGTPLDDRPNIFGRRKNPNFRKPLMGAAPAYIRTLYLMGRKKGETKFSPYQMTFFEGAAEKLTFKTNVPCEFRASAGRNKGALFGSDTTKFFPIVAEWDMDAEYENSTIACEELEARMTSTNWDDRDIRIKVDVININPNPLNERGDRVMGVADMSLPIDENLSCFIPAHVNINFGQDSKVIVVGRVRSYRGSPSVNVYGIWPIPGEITFEDVIPIDEDDIIDVGWVEPEFKLSEDGL